MKNWPIVLIVVFLCACESRLFSEDKSQKLKASNSEEQWMKITDTGRMIPAPHEEAGVLLIEKKPGEEKPAESDEAGKAQTENQVEVIIEDEKPPQEKEVEPEKRNVATDKQKGT